MGETKTHHFYDFWIFEPVTKPQNQYYLSLQTPGHLKKIMGNLQHFRGIYVFINLWILKLQHFNMFRKVGHRQIREIIHLGIQYTFGNVAYGITLFQKTRNDMLVIWVQYLVTTCELLKVRTTDTLNSETFKLQTFQRFENWELLKFEKWAIGNSGVVK